MSQRCCHRTSVWKSACLGFVLILSLLLSQISYAILMFPNLQSGRQTRYTGSLVNKIQIYFHVLYYIQITHIDAVSIYYNANYCKDEGCGPLLLRSVQQFLQLSSYFCVLNYPHFLTFLPHPF